MKLGRTLFATACLVTMVGCYAASVDTGRPASSKVVRKAWAASWIYGLVPPATVETAAECPGGVARVETQLSFLNQLIGGLTLGIYTPMQIVVTCAEESQSGLGDAGPTIHLAKDASAEEVRDAFRRAAEEAHRTRQAVLVSLDR